MMATTNDAIVNMVAGMKDYQLVNYVKRAIEDRTEFVKELVELEDKLDKARGTWVPVGEWQKTNDGEENLIRALWDGGPNPEYQWAFLSSSGMWYANGKRYDGDVTHVLTDWQLPDVPLEGE